MRTLRKIGVTLLAAAATFAVPSTSGALELISNGGFEAGFAAWTRLDFLGSDGSFLVQSGTASPVNAFPVPAPPEGTNAAMTDALGPGSHLLYQDFSASSPVPSATLSFRLFVNNTAGDFFTPPTLDPFVTGLPTVLNQQARVDIVTSGASDPFSVAAADVLLNAFLTAVGDPPVSGYSLHSLDVTSLLNAHLGESLRLRFAEADDVSVLNFGVDDVRLTVGAQVAPAPEPGSLLLILAGMLALARSGRRR